MEKSLIPAAFSNQSNSLSKQNILARSLWYKTNTDSEALEHKIKYNKNFRFDRWSERLDESIKDNQPLSRLEIALQNLPCPGAFRHSAIALRSLIRYKLKLAIDFEDELTMLYWLAAIWSFTKNDSIKNSAHIVAILEIMPAKIFKDLSFSYKDLGYEKLELLRKTDSKWLIEKWGEPESHKTLNQLYPDIFEEYQRKVKELRAKRYANWSPNTKSDFPLIANAQKKIAQNVFLLLGFSKKQEN